MTPSTPIHFLLGPLFCCQMEGVQGVISDSKLDANLEESESNFCRQMEGAEGVISDGKLDANFEEFGSNFQSSNGRSNWSRKWGFLYG